MKLEELVITLCSLAAVVLGTPLAVKAGETSRFDLICNIEVHSRLKADPEDHYTYTTEFRFDLGTRFFVMENVRSLFISLMFFQIASS
jgi:hypothetical protein